MAGSLAARQPSNYEVIDLVSDSDDGSSPAVKQEEQDARFAVDPNADVAPFHTPPEGHGTPGSFNDELPQHVRGGLGMFVNIDGEDIFIPDDFPEEPLEPPVVGAAAGPIAENDHDLPVAIDDDRTLTADDCLQRVLDIFPDISHEHVISLYHGFDQEGDYEILPGQARLDNIIEQLVSGTSYPKQEKGKKALKRKREVSTDDSQIKKWEQENRPPVPNYLKGPMQAMLKAEFPEIPVQYINETLGAQKHLYHAFVALAKAKDGNDGSSRAYSKGRPSTRYADAETIVGISGWPELLDELNAARLRVQVIRAEREAENAKKQAENENLQRAIEAGDTAECSACYDDLPMNRQIHCNGPVAHFTCFDCVTTYIKSEVGDSRCRVLCTAGCGAGFASNQLNLLSDKQLLEKLSQIQQEKDIRDAGLADLEECPFCDYKAILPPVDEDFEFRCANPECEKVSCRRCKSLSHIPQSCEQHVKDNKVNTRHKIEEAMTAALIRSCNKCQRSFIKEYGCNKMSCPSCGNMQCYVCSTTLKDYNHFDQAPAGRAAGGTASKLCPLYDNVEERHEREVKEAEAAARAQVVEENPDVTAEDLEIKVSDAVKKSTSDRIKRAGGHGGVGVHAGYPYLGGAGPPFEAMFRGLEEEDEDMDGGGMLGRLFGDVVGGVVGGAQRRRQDRAAQMARVRRGMQQEQVQRQQEQQRAHYLDIGGVAHHQPAAVPRLGHPNHVQGYIPVLGFQPPAAQAPRPQAANVAAPQPAQGQQALPGGFRGHVPFRHAFDGIFDNFGFGGDAAADLNLLPQPNAAPVQQVPHGLPGANNNGYNNARNFAPHHAHQRHLPPQAMPGAYPGPNPFVREREEPRHFHQLEMLRQQHDQRLQERQRERQEREQETGRAQQRQRQQLAELRQLERDIHQGLQNRN
ncbi:hypothetical protein LTR37_007438 [Vermiconidia calcicola]|uniref:Uncharacterized protein n=1 Tax=Vermiconidia calcicola TaxID=1690605 RepID=A0ACC3NDT5_9PEZI|nr:hypothetical protein LTR37_007438 [Vermiconidia calcicola]